MTNESGSPSAEQFSKMVKDGTLQPVPRDAYDHKKSLRRLVRTLRIWEEQDKDDADG